MDKTKHGLRISHLLALKIRALRWGDREEDKKKKEEGRREEEEKTICVWNTCLEFMIGISLLFGKILLEMLLVGIG